MARTRVPFACTLLVFALHSSISVPSYAPTVPPRPCLDVDVCSCSAVALLLRARICTLDAPRRSTSRWQHAGSTSRPTRRASSSRSTGVQMHAARSHALVQVYADERDELGLAGCYVPAGKTDSSRALYELASGTTARFLYHYQSKWVLAAQVGARFLGRVDGGGELPPTRGSWLLRRRGRWMAAPRSFSLQFIPITAPRITTDLSTLVWRTVSAMPTARSAAAGVTMANNIFVFGGAEDDCASATALRCPQSYSARAEVLNSVTSQWTSISAMPTGRYSGAAAAWQGQLHVMGGTIAPMLTPEMFSEAVEVYDTVGHTWTTSSPMPTARADATALVAESAMYAIGGAVKFD